MIYPNTANAAAQACKLLTEVERHGNRMRLGLNAKKTKVMAKNVDDPSVTTLDGTLLEIVPDLQYLGRWIVPSQHYRRVRRARVWKVLPSMKKVWKLVLSNQLKRRLFVATVVSVLLYGTKTCTLTKQNEKALDRVNTRMLRALNVSWEEHVISIE